MFPRDYESVKRFSVAKGRSGHGTSSFADEYADQTGASSNELSTTANESTTAADTEEALLAQVKSEQVHPRVKFIAKPTDHGGGRGIFVVDDLNELQSQHANETLIIQGKKNLKLL